MSFHNLSISVLKVGRQLAGSLVVAAFFMLSFQACIKEEDPIPARPVDTTLTKSQLVLSSDYRYQAFYSLEKDSMLSRNLKFEWDLAFDLTKTEGVKIQLNASKFMFVAAIDETFETVNDTFGFMKKRRWEASNFPDTPAIDIQKVMGKVFIIDGGYDEFGDPAGFFKIQLETYADGKIKFRYGKLNDKVGISIELSRNAAYNFTYFSFKKAIEVKIEPPKDAWDLQFTQYIHTFTDPYLPYLVTGVLINPYKTTIAVDSITPYEKIDRNFINTVTFTNRPDAIGYKWKDYVDNTFITKPNFTFVIKDSKTTFSSCVLLIFMMQKV